MRKQRLWLLAAILLAALVSATATAGSRLVPSSDGSFNVSNWGNPCLANANQLGCEIVRKTPTAGKTFFLEGARFVGSQPGAIARLVTGDGNTLLGITYQSEATLVFKPPVPCGGYVRWVVDNGPTAQNLAAEIDGEEP